MSRSRRKTPITSVTCAKSEKFDKRLLNRKLRRKSKRVIEIEDSDNLILPVKNEILNRWAMQKDGKIYYTKEDMKKESVKKALRK